MVFLRETHAAPLATRKTKTMKITTTPETLTLTDLAESIAMDHVADPLVGRSVAADDADDFEYLVLQRALEEWGFATSELDVDALREELRAALGREAAASEDDDDDDDDEAHDEDEENAEDAAYSLARFVEAQAYAAYLAAATGPKAPAAYDVFIAAQAATEAARIVRRDAKLRGAL